MQKADELFTEKSKTERKRVEKLMNTKEVMRVCLLVVVVACGFAVFCYFSKSHITLFRGCTKF